MADLTTEEIAELRRLHAEAVECRKQFEGKITARMAGVFVSRLPALLDMAERCAKAEAELAKAKASLGGAMDAADYEAWKQAAIRRAMMDRGDA